MGDGKRSAVAMVKAEATADLFKILKAMACDPDVPDAHFRLAFRIAQAVNARTEWAVIGDDLLSDEVPRCDHQKLRRFRRHMEELGWLKTQQGRRGRATEYLLVEDRVEAIIERCTEAKERRETAFHLRQIESRVGRQSRALGVKITPQTEESYGGEIPLDKGAILPPLLPQRSTVSSTGTSQDVALGADPSPSRIRCSECGGEAVVRCGVTGEALCDCHRWMVTRDEPI